MKLGVDLPERACNPSRAGEPVPFGMGVADGRMYEPRQVPIGKNCGCVCPACSRPVIAKHCRDGKRRPHFAHAPGAVCASATETSIHLAAKQLIRDRKLFFFPELVASVEITDVRFVVHHATKTVFPALLQDLAQVYLEQAVGAIRPDVLVEIPGLGWAAIEIAVTHFADATKKATLRSLGLAAVEVNLSGVRDATFELLEALLFEHCSESTWLYHPALDTAQDALRDELKQEAAEAWAKDVALKQALAAKRSEENARLAQARREHEARQRQLRLELESAEAEQRQQLEAKQQKTVIFRNALESEKRAILQRWLGRANLPASLLAHIPWAGSFGVSDPHVWQTAFFIGLIHKRPARGMFLLTFDTALKWLRERFESPFTHADSDELALREYLKALGDRGALLSRRQGYFLTGVADLAAFEALQDLRSNAHIPLPVLSDRVEWVDVQKWPTENQRTVIALVMSRAPSLTGSWQRFSTLVASGQRMTPYAICEMAATIGIDEATAFEYLVRTGYVQLKNLPAVESG